MFHYYDGKPLNLSEPINPGGEFGLPLIIDKYVYGGQLNNGFFIEAGSQDAEFGSNTIHFEVSHGWTGLLVEAHPIWFSRGLTRHRHVTSINTCLGVQNKLVLMFKCFLQQFVELCCLFYQLLHVL